MIKYVANTFYFFSLLYATFFTLYSAGLHVYVPYTFVVIGFCGIAGEIAFRLYYLIRPKRKFRNLMLIISDIALNATMIYDLLRLFLHDPRTAIMDSITNLGVVFMELSIVITFHYWNSILMKRKSV